MSTSLVEREIARFLASAEPEVLCMRGKWGVGKTFSWKVFVSKAKDSSALALSSYAYVSLFGLDSLDQLKYAVFENAVGAKEIGIEPSVETFKSNTIAVAKRLGIKSLSILQNLPPAKNYASALQSLSFLSVREMIVCIDDLERKGGNLPMKDVLGLISYLREQKRCKVVLILNDDALDGLDKKEFERYSEKVIDVSLEFAPDASDCVRIAVTGGGQAQDWLRTAVVALGISNIRIIKKIERLVLQVEPFVRNFDPKILHQAVQSLTLLSWSVHSKDAKDVPPLEFLRGKRGKQLYGLTDNKDQTDDEKRWNALLDQFGFTMMDEFDLVLLEGIQRGFFDEHALAIPAKELDKNIKVGQSKAAFHAAWDIYHGSFDDNEVEVVEKIFSKFRGNVQVVEPMNLNGTVRLLKELGHEDKAEEALRYYMDERQEGRNFFDLSNSAFGDEVTDPDVRDAFETKYKSFGDERSPVEILVRIAKNQSWSRDDKTLLSKLSADNFYAIFKAQKGSDFSRVIHGSLNFEDIVNADAEMKTITANAKAALVRIGGESLLSRRRVKRYGIEIG